MNPFIEISGRRLGIDYEPLVIAELGINHGGSLEIAKRMVDEASKIGVEIIKHQTHIVDDEMSLEAKNVIPGNSDISIYEIMKSCSLNEDDERELQKYVKQKGMLFISTPFSRKAAIRLESMDVPAYKIGSGECNNYPLIKHICEYQKPIILSTGMNDIISVKKAVEIFRHYGIKFALLHCTNVYPTPPELIRLNALTELKLAFPDAVIGLSDHSTTNYPSIAAVALGASIIERHFTDSNDREGPDIICSMDPQSCKELLFATKTVKKAMEGSKIPIEEEKTTMNFAFATVVTIEKITKGEFFTSNNLWVKRPGIGEIPAEKYELVLGKKANSDLQSGIHIKWSDVDNEKKTSIS